MTYVIHQGVSTRKFTAQDAQEAKDMARQHYINKAGPRFVTLVEMDGDTMSRAWMLEDPANDKAGWWVYSDA